MLVLTDSRSADVCPSLCVWMKHSTEVPSAEERNTPRVICFSVFTLGCVQLDVCVLKEQSSGRERN